MVTITERQIGEDEIRVKIKMKEAIWGNEIRGECYGVNTIGNLITVYAKTKTALRRVPFFSEN